jgi:diphthine synthase
MLYIIGLGLNKNSITEEGKQALKKCKKIYLENYTVKFPYSQNTLEKSLKRKLISLGREKVESDFLISEAKKQNIALLVYGSPLFATTHTTILEDCQEAKIKTKIIFNSSIFDAISLTGLQLYKFGKIASMPQWETNFKPDSFLNLVLQNQKSNSHSLILIDIDLSSKEALAQLQQSINKKPIKLSKILICSRLGTSQEKIYYNTLKNLKNLTIKEPFCIIIPSKLHFTEEDFLKNFN